MMKVQRLLACVGVVLFAAACEEDPQSVCTPGATQACLGPGACNGAQVCTAEGQGYGACDCGGPGTGTDGGTDAGTDPDGGTDGGFDPDGGMGDCHPVEQTGCGSGERCALVHAQGGTAGFECVAEGSAQLGEPCTQPQTGSDDCAGAALCTGGKCVALCETGAATSCVTYEVCANYEWSLTDGGSVTTGLCTATCDPVTQVRLTDDAPACGSANPASPNLGCYGQPGDAYTCAPAISSLGHGDVVNPNGEAIYLNSCAPGFLPLFHQSSGSDKVICIALCSPAETHQTATSDVDGLVPYTCSDRGAAGAECRFTHFLESTPSLTGNSVGMCLDFQNYVWDHDQNPGTAQVPFPSCTELPNFDVDGDGVADHLEWGCGPMP